MASTLDPHDADSLPAPAAAYRSTVLVLGLGDSGLAMARWSARAGLRVVVADSRAAPPQAAALAQHLPDTPVHVGFDPALLEAAHVTMVLKSPGLSPRDPALQPLLAEAAALGIPVQGELDVFTRALAQLRTERGYAPKLVAITGTNGKTTVTMLCGQLIERSGLRTVVAGNVGPSLLQTLADALDREDAEPAAATAGAAHPLAAAPAATPPEAEPAALGEDLDEVDDVGDGVSRAATEAAIDAIGPDDGQVGPSDDDALADVAPAMLAAPKPAPVFAHLPQAWVLELSSFQLDGVQDFAPDAAVVLNLSQDHLDWHGSMAAYAAAKARIHGAADARTVIVLNRDDPQLEALLPEPVAVPRPAGKAAPKAQRAQPAARQALRFGLDAPRRPGDFGLVTEQGIAWLVRAAEADPTEKRKRGSVEPSEPLQWQRLMPADALRIRGRHNVSNALAALALATAIGRPLAPMLHGLREYRGEPHRVELIATIDGVEFFDDSKGTNVGATVAALDGLGADKAPGKLAVILGGDGKGQDFAPLAEPVRRHARAVALIGRDAEAIAGVLGQANVPQQRHATLEAATRWCAAQAQAGDAVLLSPACASLDMFCNYAHRAEVFASAVRALAGDRGQVA